jgi:hypothetical protein
VQEVDSATGAEPEKDTLTNHVTTVTTLLSFLHR